MKLASWLVSNRFDAYGADWLGDLRNIGRDSVVFEKNLARRCV